MHISTRQMLCRLRWCRLCLAAHEHLQMPEGDAFFVEHTGHLHGLHTAVKHASTTHDRSRNLLDDLRYGGCCLISRLTNEDPKQRVSGGRGSGFRFRHGDVQRERTCRAVVR